MSNIIFYMPVKVLFGEGRLQDLHNEVLPGRKAKETGCDFVIALGGGFVMDCSKCIALMMTNEWDIWDYSLSASGGKKIP